MVTGSDKYGKIETSLPVIKMVDNYRVRDCGNCWHEIKDADIEQQIRDNTQKIRVGVQVKPVDYDNCKIKECRWKRKRHK